VLWAILPLSAITSWMFFTVSPYPDFADEHVNQPESERIAPA